MTDQQQHPKQLSPQQAWQELKVGNHRFVTGQVAHPHQNAARRQQLSYAQEPMAIIFGCADSRLAAEIIFDVGLGDVFVIRTAGQVMDDAVLGSLEYGVDALKIPLIIILGHDSCGAVTAAVESYNTGEIPKGFVRSLVEKITPSVIAARRNGVTDVNGTVIEHTDQTVHRLVDSSRSVSTAIEEGRLAVMAVTYSLRDGTVKVGDALGPVRP